MVATAYHPKSNKRAERTISGIKPDLVKIQMYDQQSVVRCLSIAVAAMRMIKS